MIGMAIADLHDSAPLATVSDQRRCQDEMPSSLPDSRTEPSLRIARILLDLLKASVGKEQSARQSGRLILGGFILVDAFALRETLTSERSSSQALAPLLLYCEVSPARIRTEPVPSGTFSSVLTRVQSAVPLTSQGLWE